MFLSTTKACANLNWNKDDKKPIGEEMSDMKRCIKEILQALTKDLEFLLLE